MFLDLLVDNRIPSTESGQLVSTISADSHGRGIIPATVVCPGCWTAAQLGWSRTGTVPVEWLGSGPFHSSD